MDGSHTPETPAKPFLIHTLDRIEDLLNRADVGEALALLQNLRSELLAKGTAPLDGRADYTFGLNLPDLVGRIAKEISYARTATEQADSLTNVASLALRHMDCDADGDVAHVLQEHVYPQLAATREALETADELLGRLGDLLGRAKEAANA